MYTSYLLIAAVSIFGFYLNGMPFSWRSIVYGAACLVALFGAHITETRRMATIEKLETALASFTYAEVEDVDGKPIAPGYLFVTTHKDVEDED